MSVINILKKREKLFEKLNNEFKEEFAEELKKRDNKIEKLESDKVLLQKQNLTNQSRIEELEKYGRGQCLRFEGVPTEKNETSHKVLSNVVDMCKEAGVDILDTVIDRARGSLF